MAAANYTVTLDEADKQAAEQVFNKLGLTLAAGLNVYLRAVALWQEIPFNLTLNEQANTTLNTANTTKTRMEKEHSFKALNGILAGYEIDLEKEREERIMSK